MLILNIFHNEEKLQHCASVVVEQGGEKKWAVGKKQGKVGLGRRRTGRRVRGGRCTITPG